MPHYESSAPARDREERLARPGDPILSHDGTMVLARFKRGIGIREGCYLNVARRSSMLHSAPDLDASFDPFAMAETMAIGAAFYSPAIRVYRVDRDIKIKSALDWESWFQGDLFMRGDGVNDDTRIADAIDTALTNKTVQGLVRMGGFAADADLRSYAIYLRNSD